MLDTYIEVDLESWSFKYGNNATSVIVLLALILTCIIFVSFDFWLERVKVKERNKKEMWEALKSAEIPKSAKKEIVRTLLSEK